MAKDLAPPLDSQKGVKSGDPESLHNLSDKPFKADNDFVNPGTPTTALVKKSDMPSAEASKTGSQVLRDNLIK